MTKMKSIAFCYISTYLTMYVISFIVDCSSGYLSGDFISTGVAIENPKDFLLINIFIAALSIFLTTFLFFTNRKKSANILTVGTLNLDRVVLAIACFSLYSMWVLKLNSILKVDSSSLSRVDYVVANLNYLLQPIFVCALYLYYRMNNLQALLYFRAVLGIYIACIFLSGFLWNLLFLIPIFANFIRKRIYLILWAIILCILLPILRILKWLYVTTFNNIYIVINDPMQQFYDIFRTLIGHFNIAANAYFIAELPKYEALLEMGGSNIWRQGYFSFLIDGLMNSSGRTIALPTLLAYEVNGKESWSAAIPFVNYLLVRPDIALINFCTVLLAISLAVWILKKLYTEDIRLIFGVILIFELVMSGWFAPCFQFIQAMFIFLLMVLFFSDEKNSH